MPELPSHSDVGTTDADSVIAPASGRRRALFIAVAVGAVVLFVVLHLSGVIPMGGH